MASITTQIGMVQLLFFGEFGGWNAFDGQIPLCTKPENIVASGLQIRHIIGLSRVLFAYSNIVPTVTTANSVLNSSLVSHSDSLGLSRDP